MEELKPCPFCGGSAAFVPRAVSLVLQKDPSDPKFGVSVICGKCGSESPNMVDEAHAAIVWNRRAPFPERAEVERLRDVLETLAAQSSGVVGSTSRADCMAAVAAAAIRRGPKEAA